MSYYRTPPHRGWGPGMAIGVPPLTPINRAIMIVCGAVWLVQILLYSLATTVDPLTGGPTEILTQYFGVRAAYVLSGMLWQPLTYMFLHSPVAVGHILLNMLMLWMIGGELERHWGGRKYLRYYLVCGAGAGIFVVLLGLAERTGGVVPTIGASGAVYGLLLAYGMIFSERIILFMMIFPMRARTLAWILFAIAFISNFAGARGVSHIAHLGGMIVGFLYLKRAWRVGDWVRELRWRRKRRRFRVMDPKDEDRWLH